jgi:hypothetical protein
MMGGAMAGMLGKTSGDLVSRLGVLCGLTKAADLGSVLGQAGAGGVLGAHLGGVGGGLMGAGRGDVPEGIGRGVIRGGVTGAGAGLGGALGETLMKSNPTLGTGAGAGIGGLLAFLASRRLVGKPRGKREKESADVYTRLAGEAYETPYVEKLAADSELSADMVRHLAHLVDLTPVAFVKTAYADPESFVGFLSLVSGARRVNDPVLIKRAAGGGALNMLQRAYQVLKSGAGQAGEAIAGGAKAVGKRVSQGAGQANQALRGSTAERVTRGFPASTPLGRVAGTTAVGGAGGAMAGAGAAGMMRGGGQQPAAGPGEQAVNQLAQATQTPQVVVSPQPAQPAQPAAPAPAQPAQPSQGMSQGARGALAAGAGAAAGYGAAKLTSRKKDKDKNASDADFYKAVLRRALVKKAAHAYRHQTAQLLCAHLDAVAARLPLEKAAAVRVLQGVVSSGKPLAHAIKAAYPHLGGERRGILAANMVRTAAAWAQKRANLGAAMGTTTLGAAGSGMPMQQTQTFTGTPAQGANFMQGM